jgi:hypothetical protein
MNVRNLTHATKDSQGLNQGHFGKHCRGQQTAFGVMVGGEEEFEEPIGPPHIAS